MLTSTIVSVLMDVVFYAPRRYKVETVRRTESQVPGTCQSRAKPLRVCLASPNFLSLGQRAPVNLTTSSKHQQKPANRFSPHMTGPVNLARINAT